MSDQRMTEDPNDTDWDAFCDELKVAGRVLHRSQTPRDEHTHADGLRFLARLIRIGFENAFEIGDPRHPELLPMIDSKKVYEGVTGDARYQHAFIDGRETYRIRGSRGNAPLMEFSAYTGKAGIHELSHQVGALTERELRIEDDGQIEVVLSPTPHEGNWIEIDASTRYMMIREYAHDWRGLVSSDLRIERAGSEGRRPEPTVEDMTRALSDTARFVATAAEFWAGISDFWAGSVVNRFVFQQQVDQRTDIGAPIGHQFSCGWLDLEPGEVIIARFKPDDVPFWSMGVANYWYETLGFRDADSEVNNRRVDYADDGSVRVVIGPYSRPEGFGRNWIDTRDHRSGTLIFRWSRSADPPPDIETEVVRFADLK